MYLLSSGKLPIAKGSSGKDARVVRMSSDKVPLGVYGACRCNGSVPSTQDLSLSMHIYYPLYLQSLYKTYLLAFVSDLGFEF